MWTALLPKRCERLQRNAEGSSSAEEVDFVDLCGKSVRSIEDLVKRRHLLNRRQCRDLSAKVSKTILNIRDLTSYCGASVGLFRPALKNMYRYVVKAETLVRSCAEKDWCSAAVFQCQNENAFRDILLDVSLCYSVVYEHAKNARGDWIDAPEDLRRCSDLDPTSHSDVDGDVRDLKERLDDHANGYTNIGLPNLFNGKRGVHKRNLAKYLLTKMCHKPLEVQASALNAYNPVLWTKALEPSGTWGTSCFLGAGSGATGVCSTEWLGIPCAKKDFDKEGPDEMFLKEAGILAHLKHPCIVNFICCGNGLEKGERFIAMELMEKSLSNLIEEQKGVRFAPNVAIDMIVQMARGVRYLHDCCVAHRDLKPQNVVVKRVALPHIEDHYCVKLVDFGISKMKVEASQMNTMTSEGIGTTRYRALEANPGGGKGVGVKVDWFRADAFSFAMTCIHLLSLEIPFREIMRPSELYKEVSRNGRRPRLPDGYPEELIKLLRDCWKGNPRSRPSFKEICTRLETIKYGDAIADEGQCGLDYIKKKMEEKLSEESTFVVDEEDKEYELQVPIHPCSCGSIPRLLHESPYKSGPGYCNICWEDCHEVVYHCGSCHFDAHPNCIELNEEVEVFFHDHPLHLLIKGYHHDKLDTTCYMCKESLQQSGWVYQCEECDLDVHALCTKYPRKLMRKRWHPHPLNLICYGSQKTRLLCVCCNGEVVTNTWRYTCRSCDYDMHPHCTMVSRDPLCVFNASHRSKLLKQRRGFICSICGALGFSWLYHCNDCNVDSHFECLEDLRANQDHWNHAYEEFTQEYKSKDNHNMNYVVKKILVHILESEAAEGVLEGSTRMVQPSIPRVTNPEMLELGAIDFDDADVRKKIVVETMERKAKRMELKSGGLDFKAKHLEMLKNLERLVLDMRRSESVLEGDQAMLDAGLEKLKTRERSLKDDMATLVQSKLRHGPRTCLFMIDKYGDKSVWELLTRFRADKKGVNIRFLCEEPSHQHVVDNARGLLFNRELGEELMLEVQALLGRGLAVVARAVRASAGQPMQLDRVRLPVLGSRATWDLQAIDLEKHGNPSEGEDNAVALESAEDSAALWVLNNTRLSNGSIFKKRGLLRIRYKENMEGDCPGYNRGSVAWLCKEHVQRGLEAGILECFPLKFYNPELN